MSLQYKSGEKVSASVGLLISILVRYPEISSITCEPVSNEIKFTFLLNNNKKNFDDFLKLIRKCLHALYYLQKGHALNSYNINTNICGKLTVLDIHCKMDNLSIQEINLIISLTQEYFKHSLVIENDELTKEDQLFQEDIISVMLDNIGNEMVGQKLFAFRDEGKVMVFNNK